MKKSPALNKEEALSGAMLDPVDQDDGHGSTGSWAGSPDGPRNERSSEVIRAAFELIAEKGMEGLRTREVAGRVGINSATLHYYFPTKEALIQGVVQHLMKELKTSRAAPANPQSALDLLRAEFADIRLRLKDSGDQLVVLTELAMRAWRDPVIARMLHYLDEGWRCHLISVFEAGIAEGIFRPDLDSEATANAMMSQLRGLGYQGKLEAERMDGLVSHIARQTEYWVLKDPDPMAAGTDAKKATP
jgi:AcrR family transcriptional regulator